MIQISPFNFQEIVHKDQVPCKESLFNSMQYNKDHRPSARGGNLQPSKVCIQQWNAPMILGNSTEEAFKLRNGFKADTNQQDNL